MRILGPYLYFLRKYCDCTYTYICVQVINQHSFRKEIRTGHFEQTAALLGVLFENIHISYNCNCIFELIKLQDITNIKGKSIKSSDDASLLLLFFKLGHKHILMAQSKAESSDF